MAFIPKELDIQILKSFTVISSSMVINEDMIGVVNSPINNFVGIYKFEKPNSFDSFGVHDVNEFITVLSTMKTPSIEVKDKYVIIQDGNQKSKYLTTAPNLLPKVPDLETKLSKETFDLEFDITQEKLTLIQKVSSGIKTNFVFFESVLDEDGTKTNKIRITMANELEASETSYSLTIDTGIRKNSLSNPVKISIDNLRLFAGDYTVKINSKASKWSNLNGLVNYYIGVVNVKNSVQ